MLSLSFPDILLVFDRNRKQKSYEVSIFTFYVKMDPKWFPLAKWKVIENKKLKLGISSELCNVIGNVNEIYIYLYQANRLLVVPFAYSCSFVRVFGEFSSVTCFRDVFL